MTNFFGTDRYSIDAKGRIAIPAQARKSAGKSTTFFLVPGFEGCIAVYTDTQWARVEERLQQMPPGRKARAFQRALLMDATRVTVDTQGRITIPSALIDRAGLDKEAVLLGQRSHLEIWNPDRLKQVIHDAQSNFEDLAEDVLK